MIKSIPTEHDPWWRLTGRTTGLLVLGAIVSVACSIEPVLLEKTLWLADFRQWPWWYFLAIPVAFLFSLRWYFICRDRFENDPADDSQIEGLRFIRLTGTLSALMILALVFHRLGWLRFLYNSLYYWFGFGSFSFTALFAFGIIMVAMSLLLALTWQWIQSWKQ